MEKNLYICKKTMRILAIFLTFLLFIGPVLSAVLGWPLYGFVEKSKVLYLYPSFYILFIVIIWSYLKGKLKDIRYKYAVLIIFVSFSWFIIDKICGREANLNILFHSMALPAMYFILYELLEDNTLNRNSIKIVILIMFVINALMAIYERLTLTLYFPYDLIRSEFDYALEEEVVFRSSALLGHPLTNALVMSIVMTFIIISDLNFYKKYSLYFLGFISLFCFNARAAIMISAGIFVLYNTRRLFKKGVSLSRLFFLALLLVVFISIGAYLLNAGFGGRFEENGDFSEDSSTLARIEVFAILSHYGLSNFLWGLPYKDVENMAIEVLGMTHIENWFILSTMIVGLVVTTIVTVFFVFVYRRAVKMYDLFSAFLIFIGTIVLGSTNNSFATGIPALSVFFACSYAFAPISFKGVRINVVRSPQ